MAHADPLSFRFLMVSIRVVVESPTWTRTGEQVVQNAWIFLAVMPIMNCVYNWRQVSIASRDIWTGDSLFIHRKWKSDA